MTEADKNMAAASGYKYGIDLLQYLKATIAFKQYYTPLEVEILLNKTISELEQRVFVEQANAIIKEP